MEKIMVLGNLVKQNYLKFRGNKEDTEDNMELARFFIELIGIGV